MSNPCEHKPVSARSEKISADDLRALALRFQTLLERERTRLAQELHDNLTQKLTVLALELSLLDGNILSEQDYPRARLREKVKEMGQIVTDMIQSLRKIKAELRPKVLDEFGLVAALEWESTAFQRRTGIKCRFNANPDEMVLSPHMATEVFRMFQEIISNVAEHAQARQVGVEVTQDQAGLMLRVHDDGKGITRQQRESPKSLGLLELRERAEAIGGELELIGKPGSGTVVTVRIRSAGLPAAPAPSQLIANPL